MHLDIDRSNWTHLNATRRRRWTICYVEEKRIRREKGERSEREVSSSSSSVILTQQSIKRGRERGKRESCVCAGEREWSDWSRLCPPTDSEWIHLATRAGLSRLSSRQN